MKKPRCEEESANIYGPEDHRYGPESLINKVQFDPFQTKTRPDIMD